MLQKSGECLAGPGKIPTTDLPLLADDVKWDIMHTARSVSSFIALLTDLAVCMISHSTLGDGKASCCRYLVRCKAADGAVA